MHVIVQSGDRVFWEARAVELINEARHYLQTAGNNEVYHDRMTKAISLLALSKAMVPDATLLPQTEGNSGGQSPAEAG